MKVSVFALAAAPAAALNFGGVKAAAPSMPKLPSAPALPDVPVAAVGAAALAGALALSVGSAAVGDGIVRFGMPFGGEVLVPGAPFQKENGYLGMWNWEKQGAAAVPKDQTPEVQKALMAAFQADRAKLLPASHTIDAMLSS